MCVELTKTGDIYSGVSPLGHKVEVIPHHSQKYEIILYFKGLMQDTFTTGDKTIKEVGEAINHIVRKDRREKEK